MSPFVFYHQVSLSLFVALRVCVFVCVVEQERQRVMRGGEEGKGERVSERV
jgi:hypothetical protein